MPVTTASELSPGTMKWVVIDRERVLIANVGGVYYALRDTCGHRGAPLSRGKLADHEIECPLHFARFDVRTGKQCGSVGLCVKAYPAHVSEGEVMVGIDSEPDRPSPS